jgi:hypothetical protein
MEYEQMDWYEPRGDMPYRAAREIDQTFDRTTQPIEDAGENLGRAWDRGTQPIESAWDETFYGNWYDDERRYDQRMRNRAAAERDRPARAQRQPLRDTDDEWDFYYTGYERGPYGGPRVQDRQRADQTRAQERMDRRFDDRRQAQRAPQREQMRTDARRSESNYSYYIYEPGPVDNNYGVAFQRPPGSDQSLRARVDRTATPMNGQQQQTIRGNVTGLERIRGAYGAPESVRLTLQTQDGRERTLHVGDLPFVRRALPRFQEGENVVIGGRTVNVDGRQMFKAEEIRSRDASYLIPEYAYNKRIQGTLEGVRRVATENGDVEGVVAKVRSRDGRTMNVLLGNAGDMAGQEHLLKKGTEVRVDGYERRTGGETAFVVQNVSVRGSGSQSGEQSRNNSGREAARSDRY